MSKEDVAAQVRQDHMPEITGAETAVRRIDRKVSDGGIDDASQATGADAAVHLNRGELQDDQFGNILQDAKYLLSYAVEAGIEVEADVADPIIAATRGDQIVQNPLDGKLVVAATKLAAKLHPVTAETLRACRDEAHQWISSYRKFVYWLAGFIIPLSLASFICAGISNIITNDVKTANDLLVRLHTTLDQRLATTDQAPPPNSLSDLQQFAVAMRAIYGRTRQLSWSACFASGPKINKEKLEIDPDLRYTIKEMQDQIIRFTPVYQEVRSYATNVQDRSTVLWGAIGNCVLPLLYALLGACASVLRAFTVQLEARTFAPSYATPARFIIAGIGGGVVGLFNNFIVGQGVSLPPLAIAFLVGYSTDIFFSFLEGSMPNLSKPKAR